MESRSFIDAKTNARKLSFRECLYSFTFEPSIVIWQNNEASLTKVQSQGSIGICTPDACKINRANCIRIHHRQNSHISHWFLLRDQFKNQNGYFPQATASSFCSSQVLKEANEQEIRTRYQSNPCSPWHFRDALHQTLKQLFLYMIVQFSSRITNQQHCKSQITYPYLSSSKIQTKQSDEFNRLLKPVGLPFCTAHLRWRLNYEVWLRFVFTNQHLIGVTFSCQSN